MFRQVSARFGSVFALITLLAVASPAMAQATYYTNTDNENNANTHVADNDMDVSLGNASGIHPIEFNIMVTTLPQSSAWMKLSALDFYEEQGETDDVYINGHFLGRLTGANNVWSSTAFSINPAWLVVGRNLVRVNVDTSGEVLAIQGFVGLVFGGCGHQDHGVLAIPEPGGRLRGRFPAERADHPHVRPPVRMGILERLRRGHKHQRRGAEHLVRTAGRWPADSSARSALMCGSISFSTAPVTRRRASASRALPSGPDMGASPGPNGGVPLDWSGGV